MCLRCLSTRRRRAVYMFARLFRCSRPLRVLRCCACDRRKYASESKWQQKARATSGATATATAVCWLQRTNANASCRRVTRKGWPAKSSSASSCGGLGFLPHTREGPKTPRDRNSTPQKSGAPGPSRPKPPAGRAASAPSISIGPSRTRTGTHGASRTRTPAAAGCSRPSHEDRAQTARGSPQQPPWESAT